MRPFGLLAVILFTGCLPAHSQMVLNAGDVFTYDLASAPFVLTGTRLFTPAVSAPPPFVGFEFSSLPASVDAGDVLEYQFVISGQPGQIMSTTNGSGSGFVFPVQSRTNIMIRFLMRSGSVTLDHLGIDAAENTYIPPDSVLQSSFRADVTLVPEPGMTSLLALAGLAVVLWKPDERMRRQSSNEDPV